MKWAALFTQPIVVLAEIRYVSPAIPLQIFQSVEGVLEDYLSGEGIYDTFTVFPSGISFVEVS